MVGKNVRIVPMLSQPASNLTFVLPDLPDPRRGSGFFLIAFANRAAVSVPAYVGLASIAGVAWSNWRLTKAWPWATSESCR